jgi:pimeloyl-ACP methyl ester carboxylesterase
MWVRLCAVAVALLLPTPWSEAQLLRVQEERFVTVGGIEQWVTIRGDDRSNPVLLILHGGPGEAQSPLASVYAPLERNFVVVQWDQRGGGRTRARASGSAQSASLERLVEDGIELTEYIRGYLRTSNVLLVGHSWGSFLGVHIESDDQNCFAASLGPDKW